MSTETTATPIQDTATTTAPVQTTQTTTAPVPPTAEERRDLARRAGHGDTDAFAKWMGMDKAAAPAASPAGPPAASTVPAEPETGRVRGEGGRFVKADGAADSAAEATADTTEPPAKEKPAAPSERTPGIALLGADGQALDVDAGTVKLRARLGGEDVELPLGDVLRRANGQAGAQRHAARLEQELGQAQTAHEQLLEAFEDLRVLGVRLAMGEVPEQELAALRDTLRAQLSPGAIAEQRRQDEREARERQREEQTQAARTETATELVPVLAALLRDHPQVTEEEINGKMLADTARWCAPGSAAIKPEHLPDFRAYLAQELPRFVRQRQAERAGTHRAERTTERTTERTPTRATPPTEPATTDAVRRAQEEAQRAKNALAEAVRPSGALPVEGTAAERKPAFRTQEDRKAWALGPFAQLAGAGGR